MFGVGIIGEKVTKKQVLDYKKVVIQKVEELTIQYENATEEEKESLLKRLNAEKQSLEMTLKYIKENGY